MSVMNTEDRKPTNLELFFFNRDELDEMTSDPDFHRFVKLETYKAIEYAIENNLPTVEVFKLWNLGYMVLISENQYKEVLNHILPVFEEEEEYDECLKIKNLIKRL